MCTCCKSTGTNRSSYYTSDVSDLLSTQVSPSSTVGDEQPQQQQLSSNFIHDETDTVARDIDTQSEHKSPVKSTRVKFNKLPPNMVSEGNRSQYISNNYNSMNHNNNNNNNNNNTRVLGIILTSDKLFTVDSSSSDDSSMTILESIILEKDINCCTCEELRRLILSQLASAPKKFAFLTKEGWPVRQVDESKLSANVVVHDSNHVRIKQSYDKPKIGIESERPIGFVFSDIASSLETLRVEIDTVLKEIASHDYDKIPDYQFIDRNGWPVLKTQEGGLSTLDLLCSQVIKIRFDRPTRPNSLPNRLRAINGSLDGGNLTNNYLGSPHSTMSPANVNNDYNLSLPNQTFCNSTVDGMISIQENTTEVREDILKRRGSKKGSSIVRTFSKRKSDKIIRIKPSPQTKHTIMLSYARAEAADHALFLKMELRKLNLSTYLDVHEISTGTDWQDSLNNAVSNCVMFVPLVTPMYGNTQWTNREVKLADVLEKKIVPINFLDTWPPECLAIQFATTQYINWLSGRETGDGSADQLDGIKLWPKVCIKRIAKTLELELNKCLKEQKSKVKTITSPPMDTPTATIPSLCCSTIDSAPGDSRLVVILVHPKEYQIAKKIRESLEQEQYFVWCSSDHSSLHGASEDPGPKTSHNAMTPTGTCLPTITEGSVFSEGTGPHPDDTKDYRVIAKQLVESKVRPKSMPPIEGNSDRCSDTTDSGIMASSFSIDDACPMRSDHTVDTSLIAINSTQSLGLIGTRSKHLARMNSQISTLSQHSSLIAETTDQLKLFRSKADNARAVIVVVSDNYLHSSTSKQQLFYCESRKKLIIVDAGVTESLALTHLMRGKTTVKSTDAKFTESIKLQIRRIMDPNTTDSTSSADVYENKISYCVRMMAKNIDYIQKCVYVFGSTKITDSRTKEICREIGFALAKVNNLTLVTSGYDGAQALVAQAFFQAIQGTVDEDGVEASKSRIVHVLPSEDVKGNQPDDDSCPRVADGHLNEPMSYGRTLFVGETPAEQNTVLFRLLDTAILIQGDESTARQVDEFIWNDHFVIPVISTGGAASGYHNVSLRVFDRPNGVDSTSWAAMSDKTLPPVEVAKAVVKAVIETKDHIATMKLTGNKKYNSKFKSKLRKSSKKRVTIDKIEFEKTPSNLSLNTVPIDSDSSPEKSLPIVEVDHLKHSEGSRWRRVKSMFVKNC